MTMKTILIPAERGESMSSALHSALLLARRFDSYIEGFALQPGISQLLAVDMGASIATESFRQESIEEAKKTRAMFEAFSRNRAFRVPVRRHPAFRSAGWTTPPRVRTSSAATAGSSTSSS
jgi:hypothetical protein